MSESLKLSISLMTSNRKDTIRKCLDSLAHLRKTIPSELVIVDTGCDDEMRSIIEEYADRIVKFEWCNDFAAARNAGMQACTGNWFLFLDDDEWFEDTKDIEDFFLKGDCNKFGEASYIVRNYGKPDGSIYQDGFVKRIIRLDEKTKFVGRIHESLLPSYEEKTVLHSFVHHYGYAFPDNESNVRHSYRNIIPLREGVVEEPDNMHWRVQLALEYIAVGEYRSLQELCTESLRLLEHQEGKTENIYRGAFYDGLVYALYHMRQYRPAMELAEEFVLDWRNTKMAMMYLYRWLTELYILDGQLDEAREAICCYQEYEAEYAENPDAFFEEDMIISRTAVDDSYRERMEEVRKQIETGEVTPLDVGTPELGEKYARLMQLEQQLDANSKDVELCLELADCYYTLGENGRQEALAKRCLDFVSDELRQLFICYYVDALFTECRYDKAVEAIKTYGTDASMSDVAVGMLFCEGCISEHRQRHHDEAAIYGKAYLERFIQYYQMADEIPKVIGAAYRMGAYELVKEALNNIV